MATKTEKPIKNFLMDFGLTDKEITLYLTLLKTGPNTIMNLARETGIKRSTTHNNVEELIKKGLVSQTNYGERRMVIAEDPGKLEFLLEQKKWGMRKLEDNLVDVVKMIGESIPNAKENTQVEVKYYEGKDGVSIIYKMAFESPELRSYVNLAEVSEVFPNNRDLFLSSQKKNPNLKVMEIIHDSEESRANAEQFAKNANFQYKIKPASMNLTAVDILVFDDKVAMIHFKESITGVVITNREYNEYSKALFDFVWDTL